MTNPVTANILAQLMYLTEQSRARMIQLVGSDFAHSETEQAREAIQEFNIQRSILHWAERIHWGKEPLSKQEITLERKWQETEKLRRGHLGLIKRGE